MVFDVRRALDMHFPKETEKENVHVDIKTMGFFIGERRRRIHLVAADLTEIRFQPESFQIAKIGTSTIRSECQGALGAGGDDG